MNGLNFHFAKIESESLAYHIRETAEQKFIYPKFVNSEGEHERNGEYLAIYKLLDDSYCVVEVTDASTATIYFVETLVNAEELLGSLVVNIDEL